MSANYLYIFIFIYLYFVHIWGFCMQSELYIHVCYCFNIEFIKQKDLEDLLS